LPKENRGDTVVLNGTFRFAAVEQLTGKSEAAAFVPSMLTRGAGDLSREQIARRLDELKAQLGFSGGPQSVGFSLTTTRENLPAAVDLIALMLKSPTFPEDEFEQLRAQSITSVESSMTEPQAIAGNAMGRHFNPWPKGHPYYNETFEESLASLRALTLQQVKDFHREFYGAGFGEIAVVGDFDAAAFQAQAEKHFGGWSARHAFVRLPDPAVEVPTADASFETPDKANAIIMMRTDLPLSDTHADYVALSAASYVLGGGTLKSRLADRVRQKEGLSYSVGSQFVADALDENATLMAYAIAAPQNIDKVETAIREEVARMLESGVEADELKDAVDGLLRARQRNRGEDGALVGALRENLYLGRRFDFAAGLDAQYAALTPAQVHAAFKRHFGLRPLSVFKAGDFEKVKASPAK
jgi:zinc protease